QEPARPGRHRRGQVAGAPECRDDDDLPGEPFLAQPPGDLQPVAARHLDVEQGDVRLVPIRHRDRLAAAGGLRHHGDVVLQLQQGNQGLADHRLVLGDHDAHGHDGIRSRPGSRPASAGAAGPASGTLTRSQNPPCSPAPADRVPPRRAARPASPARPDPATGAASSGPATGAASSGPATGAASSGPATGAASSGPATGAASPGPVSPGPAPVPAVRPAPASGAVAPPAPRGAAPPGTAPRASPPPPGRPALARAR